MGSIFVCSVDEGAKTGLETVLTCFGAVSRYERLEGIIQIDC